MTLAVPLRIPIALFTLCIALGGCGCSNEGSKARKLPPLAIGAQADAPLATGSASALGALTSYWQGEAESAAKAFAREDWQAARDAFAKLKLDGEAADRRELMLALCDAELGQHQQAAKHLEALIERMPLLQNFLRYRAARSAYFAGDHAGAARLAKSVEPSSVDGADASLLLGDVLRAQDAPAAELLAHYQGYVAERPDGIRLAEAHYRIGAAALAVSDTATATAALQRVLVSYPLSPWAQRASELVAKSKLELPALSAAQHIERAHVLYRNNRNEDSEAGFAAALALADIDKASRCDALFHQANSVYKQRNREKAAPLFLKAIAACELAASDDLYVKAAYQAGRSFATLGERDKALAHYELIEEKHPAHSYADDARLLRAEEYERLGDSDKAKELLSTIGERYPGGDMSTEALWRLAWREYKDKNYQASIDWLEKQIASAPIDDRFWAEGQAQYWIARNRGKLGEKDKALEAYRQVIRDYPLSYYSLLALNRLREEHAAVFAEVVTEIRAKPPAGSGAFAFKERPEYQSAGFARATELLRLGLSAAAASELYRLGFTSPGHRDRLTDADEIDRTWAMVVLYHSIGDYSRSLWPTRWHVLDYKRHWPEGAWRKRWEMAYPPGYAQLIAEKAKARNIPAELVISFVREESGFNPIQESFANAIGLSQLIIPTAKRFSGGVEVNRTSLRDPATNLDIGTRFMAFLFDKWKGQVSLIVPSYNAGEGAVARWMTERGDWDRDAFAEEIPYDETRHYSKRVISSYFTYVYLRTGEIPKMPNRFDDAP